MSFSIDGRNLPAIRSFADCERLFNRRLGELTPRRKNGNTWSETVLPLRDDNGAWKDTSKRFEKDGDSYACFYHRTPVVTYFADGRIEFEAGWDSVSTGIFFDTVSPMDWTITREHGHRFYYHNSGQWHTCTRAEPLRLDADGKVTNGVPFKRTKTLANMPRRREIREKLKPFYEWFNAMTRVTNSVASVVNADDMPLESSSRLWVSHTTFVEAVKLLVDPEAGESDWRFACSCARAAVDPSPWVPWEARSFESKFGIEYAPLMKKRIEHVLWKEFGGWRKVEVIVQPGEKP